MVTEYIPECALDWHRAGQGAVLATVVETWGSAPRRAGSQMAVRGDGLFAGSVSGGCVEGAVVAEALDVLAAGQPRLLEYGVSDENAFAQGLACGGRIRILLEPVGPVLPEALLAKLVAARVARLSVAQVVETDGTRRLIRGGEDASVDMRLRADRSGAEADGRVVIVHAPPVRLIVVGAVQIAQALVPMARIAGLFPVLVDPRTAFASAARFPGETLIHDWPDEALARLAPEARTAVVTLTHDPKLDDPAIRAALATPVFYLGSLGSRRTHAARMERLAAAGVPPQALARIDAPVGLDIGAATPAEIAVSVLAAVISALRRAAPE
ncbi:XdhC family protein [Neotabrizicola sp. VNH66]|uniref:XdhC family protein n=1 Tax=Neotabrizicola sp. VNH66 TaxID=3400918 RepID=UPI003C065DAF